MWASSHLTSAASPVTDMKLIHLQHVCSAITSWEYADRRVLISQSFCVAQGRKSSGISPSKDQNQTHLTPNHECCWLMSSSMFGCSVNSLVCWYAIIGQTKSCIDGYTRILQRRARRHATINVVDFSDVTRCQNMVDDSDVKMCQNIRKVLEHMYPDKNVMWHTHTHTETFFSESSFSLV